MINLSTGLSEQLWGNEAVLRGLDYLEKEFNNGHRFCLFLTIAMCARFQAVIPDWAATAILNGETGLEDGDVVDMNQLFGWDQLAKEETKITNRRNKARRKKYKKQVLAELFVYRLGGGGLNTEEAFSPVAEKLGLSRRDVEAIYRDYGEFVRHIPQSRNSDVIHGFMDANLDPPRRYGRKILEDKS